MNHVQFEAYLEKIDMVVVFLPMGVSDVNEHFFSLINEEEKIELSVFKVETLPTVIKIYCKAEENVRLDTHYLVTTNKGLQVELSIGSVIRTKEFDQFFYYDGTDLGATYCDEKTMFKVWAPTATNVELLLYHQEGKFKQKIPMERSSKGTWTVTQYGNLEGCYYLYNVCVNKEWKEVVDPYVKGTTVNGEFGVVIDLAKTKIKKQSHLLPEFHSPTDAIIYETHIRDFSIHPESGAMYKGKYKAFTEEQTKGPNDCKTCVDYLVELGITHVQLLPFNDFGGVNEGAIEDEFHWRYNPAPYNWGYNPVNYNVPEGSYATDPYDPYVRILETKEMIEALHQKGIRVIMDVVYNHVYILEASSFEKIVPGYFFRYNDYGLPSNGTGVGNDIASERLMVRKFIIDSVTFWAKEYNIDGFRFDLMGILDVETMKAVRTALDLIDPSIIIVGEGWNLDTPIPDEKKAIIKNASELPGIAHFNDLFRDTVKGSSFDLRDKGFISGVTTKKAFLMELLAGSISLQKNINGMFESPCQSINYIECHDNHTLWDKLAQCNGDEKDSVRRKRQILGIAIVLLSQGIPFLHSGIEYFRTKYGEGNSYNLPDYINQLDWARKDMYKEYLSYTRMLISIRKAHPAFRLATANEIRYHYRWLETPPEMAGYILEQLEHIDTWKAIIVLFNSSVKQQVFKIPDDDTWNVAVYGEKASLQGLYKINKTLQIMAISTVVLFK
ncbi:type I pullulanase [Calidifontibacillus oryziterrae]|uniref:type I pullulanase n=1 Tax=Calidifontibacillus oryziterrae TaxID=1191699 RepID=UPI0002E46E61|nr:type I pullulanase [Calidifontibacillus oryziterrae]